MHHNMAEFVCQTEPLAIRRHIPVQENAWRHVWYLNGKTINLEGTPTFFVNGQWITQPSYNALKSAIDQAVE